MMRLNKLVLLLLSFCGVLPLTAQTKIFIETGKGTQTISRHIYGHFSEHLGRCIYDGIWVGKTSKIPNINGYRSDVVAALKEIGIPNLRWPGGCFADIYHWQDGIGPQAKRLPILNYHWGNVTEDNSFGTHEFLDLCELLECEPYLAANMGTGTPRELKDWVQYVNSSGISPMTTLRAANGRAKPWAVKYWGIGNEVWGCGGNMNAEYYANVYNHFATFCRDYDNIRCQRIACGPYGADTTWTATLLKNVNRGLLQGISMHLYTVLRGDWNKKGSATQFTEEEWFEQIKATLQMEEAINLNAKVMDRFDPKKEIGLVVDEWGDWYDVEPGTNGGFLYQQSSLRDALVAAINLNMFNNHCDRVKMANIAQTVNVLQSIVLTRGAETVRTPTYYAFRLFRPHHDATLLPSRIESAPYAFGGQSIPAVTVSASKDSAGVIHITLTNADPNQGQEVACNLGGFSPEQVDGRIITADAITAYNDFGKPEAVKIQPFEGERIFGDKILLTLPAKSVLMLEMR